MAFGTDPSSLDLVTVQQNGVRALNNLATVIGNTFPNWVGVPASASAAGTPGQVAYDATHFYACVATNTWVRCTLSTF